MGRARSRDAQLPLLADTAQLKSQTAMKRAGPRRRRYRSMLVHTMDRQRQPPETARARVASMRRFACTSGVVRGDTSRTLRDFVAAARALHRAGDRAEAPG